MENLIKLQSLITLWAYDRELIVLAYAGKQRLKLIEKSGELASAILKKDIAGQKDAIGDMFVVLVILAEQQNYKLDLAKMLKRSDDTYSTDVATLIHEIIHCSFHGVTSAISILSHLSKLLGFDLTGCVNLAYNSIKNRTGNTINGTCIKD